MNVRFYLYKSLLGICTSILPKKIDRGKEAAPVNSDWQSIFGMAWGDGSYFIVLLLCNDTQSRQEDGELMLPPTPPSRYQTTSAAGYCKCIINDPLSNHVRDLWDVRWSLRAQQPFRGWRNANYLQNGLHILEKRTKIQKSLYAIFYPLDEKTDKNDFPFLYTSKNLWHTNIFLCVSFIL